MFSDRTNWRLEQNALTQALEDARRAGQKILDLTVSNPTEAGVRPDRGAVLSALANPKAMHYDPQPRGLLEARNAVSRYYLGSSQDSRSRSRADHSDHQHQRSLLVRVPAYSVIANDEILVPKPSYPLFEFSS